VGDKPRIEGDNGQGLTPLNECTDIQLVNDLLRRGYALKPPQSKKDREMAVDLTDISTGATRHMRKLELLVPEGSPLWWPKE